jgi:ABC-type antimicrobial peptide transport system permease subunit
MKIINELASSTIKSSRKDTLATRLSILLAVILLGTVVFIISSLKENSYNAVLSTVGDYHVSINGVTEQMYRSLSENKDIKQIFFDKLTETNLNAIIYEKGDYYWTLNGFEPVTGRKPEHAGELMVPTRFLVKNKEFKLGSELNIHNKNYTIVGDYDDHSYTFEEYAFMGYLDDMSKENLFTAESGVEAFIWFKNPRNTYTLTKELLKDFNIDIKVAESTGRLYFNKPILEYKMIYPSGIIPPKSVVSKAVETYLPLALLVLLFAVMIYGAFNVWNNRNIREIALLKSVGMTEKQVKKMVRTKAMKLSVIPIAVGTGLAYLVANLLLYLMWLNNSITYSKLSDIFSEKMQIPTFEIISLSVPAIILIILLSLTTVYISALLPAKRSAKLKIIEGLNGIPEKKVKFGKSKITGRIEKSLAKDYFMSYRSTYKTIILAMVVSALVLTVILVSQSYQEIVKEYDSFHSPYNFTSSIHTQSELDRGLINDIKRVAGIDELHIYGNKYFKFFPDDNQGFLSDEFQAAIDEGRKFKDTLYAGIYGLSNEDYQSLLKENGLEDRISYVLLNKIANDNTTPYAFRTYIPVTDTEGKGINLKYDVKGKVLAVPIEGYIDEFPYNLEGMGKNSIYIFTEMSNLEALIREHGQDKGDPVNYYNINIKEKDNLRAIADECERIILSYVPKSDHTTSTDILKVALNKEERKNEHLLNAGIQIILLIIALSNAYNSFHGNLRSRKREFQILSTVGMTEKQMKDMIFSESKILFRKTFVTYILVFCLAISVRAYRSNFDFGFAVKEIAFNLNYIPIILIFTVMALGILLAIKSSIKSILREDLNNAMREI